jgi:hypothetical protein
VPAERAVDLATQVARALAYAHGHLVSHGDLTPSAVLVDRKARVHINNFQFPPDMAYFEPLDTLLLDAELPVTPADRGDKAAEDVRAAGLLLWQLLSEPAAPAIAEGAAAHGTDRTFRRDVPDSVRDVVRHCIDRTHPDRITDARVLAEALESLAQDFEHGRPAKLEDTPPALRVAREALAREAAWSAEDTQGGLARWNTGRGAREASPGATTEPMPPGVRLPRPVSGPTAAVGPPRLRLPSRPIAERAPRLAPASHPASANSTTVPMRSPDALAGSGDDAHRMSGTALLLMAGVALFVLFFLIGYFFAPPLPFGR